jgi:hypothetical protein
MSSFKTFGLTIFAVVGLLGETVGSARAQCGTGCATEWSGGSVINLQPLPGTPFTQAYSINDAGQAVWREHR